MKKACFFLLLSVSAVQTNAFSIANLTGKKWHYVSALPNDIVNMDIEYQQSMATICVHINGQDDGFIWKFKYHLSNEKNPTFTENNVGNITEGQYIVMKGINMPEGADSNIVFCIEELTTDTLRLKILENNTIFSSDAQKEWTFCCDKEYRNY